MFSPKQSPYSPSTTEEKLFTWQENERKTNGFPSLNTKSTS